MSRKDDINIEKNILSGNAVSHSNRKTKRFFVPNIQQFTFTSELLGGKIKLKSTPSTVRTILKSDGIDRFLTRSKESSLGTKALRLRRRIFNIIRKKSSKTAKPRI